MGNISSYFKRDFFSDLKAGFITAVVALPLAIAFAIASGVSPIMGIYTAIIAGVLASLIGGSKFSITGPTGAMTVIILSTLNKFGLEGLMLAGFLSGVMLIIFGVVKLGKVVKFIPLPIISGFTAGIGVIIFIGQIPNFLGIKVLPHEHVWDTLFEIFKSLNLINYIAIAIAAVTILLLVFLPKILFKIKYLKNIPASFVALVLAISFVFFTHASVPLVGEIPIGIPDFNFVNINFELVKAVLPAAFTIALLGAIESLLCAVVADGMTSTKHNSNKELIGQGVVNVIIPFFGAIPATAAIARTAVNIKEGARTRFAGVYHALFLLIIVVFFGSVAMYMPMPFLAGVLMFVSFRMINFKEFRTIMHISKADTVVLFVTFLLTIFTNLVFAVQVGMFAAIFLLFIRLTDMINISSHLDLEEYDSGDGRVKQLPKEIKDKVNVYTINGPFFFGAMNVFDDKVSEEINLQKKYFILRMRHVPFIDSTGVERLKTFIQKQKKRKVVVLMTGLKPEVYAKLFADAEFKHIMDKKYLFDRTSEALHYVEFIHNEK